MNKQKTNQELLDNALLNNHNIDLIEIQRVQDLIDTINEIDNIS